MNRYLKRFGQITAVAGLVAAISPDFSNYEGEVRLDSESGSILTPTAELFRARKEFAYSVASRASGILEADDGFQSPLVSGFRIYLPDSLPDEGSLEDEAAHERLILAARYMMLHNDVSERLDYLARLEGFTDVVARVRLDHADCREALLSLLEDQGYEDGDVYIERFERENAVLLEAASSEDIDYSFTVEQKEIANIIYEDFTTRLLLGENPLAEDVEVQSYEDLQSKYSGYLKLSTEVNAEERGLLMMHYLAMSTQAWDDLNGRHADARIGILQPATYLMSEGASDSVIAQEMEVLAEEAKAKAFQLNGGVLMVGATEGMVKYGMPYLIHRYKRGAYPWDKEQTKDSMDAMRMAMGAAGLYDPN